MEDIRRASAYAMLMAMHEEGTEFHSLKDCFIPLVLQAFPSEGKATMMQIKSKMDAIYQLPENSLQLILERAMGTDRIDYDEETQLYEIKSNTQNRFMDSVNDADKRIFELVNDVDKYFRDHHFVPSREKKTIKIILTFVERSSLLLKMQSSTMTDLSHVTVEDGGSRKLLKYIQAKLQAEVPDVHFRTLMEVAKGAIITEAITWTDLKHVKVDNYKNCYTFIDTNIIFSLYKLHSDSQNKAVKQLMSLLKLFNFDLYVFNFTMDQIRGVLYSIDPEDPDNKPGSIASKFNTRIEARQKEQEIRDTLEDSFGIRVYQSEITIEHNKTPDNPDIEKMLDIYGEHFEQRKNFYSKESRAFGKIHDFAAISIVNSLRGDEEATIYKPKAMFLTEDRKLADFNRLDINDNNNTLPEVVLDTQLAGVLWFLCRDRDRDKEKEDIQLSPQMILAAYSRNLLINENIWNRATDILEKVVKQRELNIKSLPHIFYLDYQSMLSNCKSATKITTDRVNEMIVEAYDIQKRKKREKQKLQEELEQKKSDYDNLLKKNKELEQTLREIEERGKITEAKKTSTRKILWFIISIIVIGVIIFFITKNGQ